MWGEGGLVFGFRSIVIVGVGVVGCGWCVLLLLVGWAFLVVILIWGGFGGFMREISADVLMKDVLGAFPGARRALFAKYHIGGCSSCAYGDEETLGDVCVRNELGVDEVVEHILASHEVDQGMLISPLEVKALMDAEEDVYLLDTRTREEHEAVTIEGAKFMTQELQQELFGTWGEERLLVIFDHTGGKVLDTCAWFQGHGLKGAKGMIGGIDAWSREVDSGVGRYRLEME